MNGAKRKTVRKVIRQKIDDWLKSIDDEEIRIIIRENVIVTGGSITSLLMGDKVNDFDVYFRDLESTKKVAEYYTKRFNEDMNPKIKPYIKIANLRNIKGQEEKRVCVFVQSSGVAGQGDDSTYEYYEMTDNKHGDKAENYVDNMVKDVHGDKLPEEDDSKPKYRPVFMSQNAITLKNKIQLVIRFYGEPSEIHSNYDFQHAMCSYDYGKDVLDLPAEALESMLSKTLYYKGSLYPICSIFRLRKFIERGWRVSAGEMLKICWQISEIDLNDPYILREQLTGVDAAYFHQLINLMDKHKQSAEDKGTKLEIDSTYIVELIDEIFNT